MSELLERLADARAFRPSGNLNELAVHHVALGELTNVNPEARLQNVLSRAHGQRIAVRGPSGAGKSSLIAAVLAALSPDRFVALVVNAGSAGTALAEPSQFLLYVLNAILTEADSILGRGDQPRVRGLGARRTETTSAQRVVGARLGVRLPFLDAQLAGEIRGGVDRHEFEAHPQRTQDGLQRVVDILRNRSRNPIIVLDDTDKWAGGPSGDVDETAATQFFGLGLPALRELDVDVVVAVHERFADLPSYKTAADRFFDDHIEIPRFPDPHRPLIAILQRRLERELDEPAAWIEEVFDDAALTVLDAAYGERPQDLRYVLRCADQAVLVAHEQGARRVERLHTLEALERVRR